MDENIRLKRRVDELEALVSSFLNSIPLPPSMPPLSTKNEAIAPPTTLDHPTSAAAANLEANIRPSLEQTQIKPADQAAVTLINHPLLPSFKIETHHQQLAKDVEQAAEIKKSIVVEGSIEHDILKIQGSLKQTPSSVHELIHMLESSLFGVSQAMDRLKI